VQHKSSIQKMYPMFCLFRSPGTIQGPTRNQNLSANKCSPCACLCACA